MTRPKPTEIEPTYEPTPCQHRSRKSREHPDRAIFREYKCLAPGCGMVGYQAAGSTRITWTQVSASEIERLNAAFKDS